MEVEMVLIGCANCSVNFAITSQLQKMRREDHKEFYCPMGHVNYYPAKSDIEILREKLSKSNKELEEKKQYLESSRKAVRDLQNAQKEQISAFVKENFKKGLKTISVKFVADHFKMKIREIVQLVRLAGFECKRSSIGYQIVKKEK